MALTTAPDFNDGILTASKLQSLSDAINERTPLLTITSRTSTSATFTAETVIDSVTASLISGYRYKVCYNSRVQSTVADGYVRARLREDTVAGTQMTSTQTITSPASGQSWQVWIEVFYTAVATGSKTFVATMIRQAGTGNLSSFADATTPAYLYVEFVGSA